MFCAGIRMGPDVKWYGNVGSGGWGVKGLKFTTFQSGIKRNKITFLKLKLEGRNKNVKRLFMLTSCLVAKVFIITHTIFS